IFDPLFPRSVVFCLNQCQMAAHAISGTPRSPGGASPGEELPTNEVETLLGDLAGWLDGCTMTEIIQAGLHESLTRVVDGIHDIGDAIYRTYFDVKPQLPALSVVSGP